MDLEQLTKHQIILLTLLVSFVTSIATGIVTVTLLDQAPPVVTQTINRVVERTVERVIPAEVTSNNSGPTTIIEKETTVVVKENDLITESIEVNRRKLVRLFSVEEDTIEESATSTEPGEETAERDFLGLGIVVSPLGLVAADSSVIKSVPASSIRAVTSEGALYEVVVAAKGDTNPTVLLELVLSEEESVSFNSVSFVSESSLKLGQTVIALSGEERTNVTIGIIAGLRERDKEIDENVVADLIEINTNIAGNNVIGSPLLNIFGEIIGLKTTSSLGEGTFTPINVVRAQIAIFQGESAEIEGTEQASAVE